MASQTAINTPSGFETTKNLKVLASSNLLKVKDGKELAPDPVAPTTLTEQVMLPFSISSSLYSFIGPFLDADQAKEVHTFFPSIMTQDILASQEKIPL